MLSDVRHSVIFVDASRDYEEGTNQNRLGPEHLTKIIAAVTARETVDKYAYRATLSDIRDNDFNLNLPRYVDTYEAEAEIDLMEVRAERLRLKDEMEGLETRMAGYLRELGF